MSNNHSPARAHGFSEATAGESSSQPRSEVRQSKRKLETVSTTDLSKPSKRSRRDSVAQNADHEGASLNQNVEDTHLHVSTDDHHSTMSQNPSVNFLGQHASAAPAARGGPAGLDAADHFQTTYLKIFDTAIEKLVDVPSYAKMALGVLSAASKIILAQADHDPLVHRLLKKLDEVYRFTTQDDTLGQISSMHSIIGRIARQTQECARFIRDYSKTKSFWKRLGKNVVSETDDMIAQYSDALDGLMERFRDQTLRNAAIFVQCTGETLDLSDMAYAKGAGLDTRKQCLPGTRTEILSQITDWINDSDDAAERVLWLSGPAGTGKSAIAHTIAKWFNDMGGLGSCFCFGRGREAEKRHEKVFSTIARDLADRDREMRRTLANAVKNETALKNTTDIFQQWEKLMEPLGQYSGTSVGPVLIVIEALDESGGVETRRDLLRILAGKLEQQGLPEITELPSNFRILITSRPLHDIDQGFHGAQHIRRLSMDDILPEVAERDIRTFVSEELKGRSVFGEKEIGILAAKAGGLFEWARLACEYIKKDLPNINPISRFNAVVNSGAGKRKNFLYNMYRLILTEIMKEDQYDDDDEYQEALAGFRSVMGQILATAEPLPFDALNSMRNYLPDGSQHDNMGIVKHMGSLLSGTTNSSTPIRPLHASFHEFLTDKSSSGEFFVEVSKMQRDLAFASLQVMEDGLRFNICDLKSSYLPNCEDTGLRQRAESCIPPHLSYSCRSWATHVFATDFDTELAKEIKSFFNHERLLFWIEVLGLLNKLNPAIAARQFLAQWLKGHSGYEDILSTAIDVQRFVQVFGGMILHSTPHLYVSALPFSPVNSTMATKFTSQFPNSLHLTAGRDLNWAAAQTVIIGHTNYVQSVSFSPDGTRIVSGSRDDTVRLWDAATGQPLGQPLRGHTDLVWSVSFSPDGTRIVSCSEDTTVRLWDAATGQPLGQPLRGHTSSVESVSFSPDGTRIVSGSLDKTVRLWDAATGQPLGQPLRGHTLVFSVSFSSDGTRVVSGSQDKTVRLWDAATGQPLGQPLRGHTDSVESVSFSPDGTRIVSGSSDKTVRLWDAATGQPLGQPLRGHTSLVSSVSFSPDGTRIVSGSWDQTVRLWDAATGRPLGRPLRGHTDSVRSVSFSPDGTRIVSGSWDQTVRLWDAATGQPLGQPLRGHTDVVRSALFSPDGTRIVSGSSDMTVRLWDAATGQPLGQPLRGHTSSVLSVLFSPDGTRIVSGSQDTTVRLWDAVTGKPLGRPLRGHTSVVWSVSFSPDGTRIVSGSHDRSVRLWDAATGQPLGQPLRGHTDLVWSVSFSPDGTRIVSGSQDNTIRLWDAATGQPLGQPLRGHTDSVSSVSFSPDGTRIVSGSHDHTVRLWDAVTSQPLGQPLWGHTDSVWSVSFSPDSTRIVSGSLDMTIRLWDAAMGQPFRVYPGTNFSTSPPDNSYNTPHTQENPIIYTNTWDHRTICFSSSLVHALPAELLDDTSHHDSNSTPFLLRRDGWMLGPDCQLLFWVPPASREPFYTPGTVMVIPRGGAELNLSRMAHGTRWPDCHGNAPTQHRL